MARRKGRSGAWGAFALVFPPLLLLFVCVPAKRKPEVTPAVGACSVCGGAVSVQAASCPHCGQPQSPVVVSHPWYAVPVEVAGTVVVLAGVAWAIWWFSQTLGAGLPRCDSSLAKFDVNRALANAPIGKVMGISVASFDAIQTDYQDDKVVRCSADVTLNNNTKHKLTFSFTARDDSNYWVEAKIVSVAGIPRLDQAAMAAGAGFQFHGSSSSRRLTVWPATSCCRTSRR